MELSPFVTLFIGTIIMGAVAAFVSGLIATILKRKYNVDSTWEPFALTLGTMMVYFGLVYPLAY